MRALLLPLLAVLASAQAAPDKPGPTRFDDAARARCEAQGGQVATAGLSGEDMCALPHSDAGRSCTGSDQCGGYCELDGSRMNGKRPEVGARVPGRCQAMNYPFGCHETVEQGRYQGTLCVD